MRRYAERAEMQRAVDLAASGLSQVEVARAMGRPRATVQGWLRSGGIAEQQGIKPGQPEKPRVRVTTEGQVRGGVSLRDALKRGGTIVELADLTQMHEGDLRAEIAGLRANGINISERNGIFAIERTQQPAFIRGAHVTIETDASNLFTFGFVTDSHLGSKYARLDVLNDLYDRFAARGIKTVFNAGNWIDGEARFNRHDLIVHGMDAQLDFLARHYPRRAGISTYAVAGDDHEGWYAQREGVEIGRYAQHKMREAGRDDWHDLGYMEAHVLLKNSNTGATQVMNVVHPGGGSAYAVSYAAQKYVESLDGGEKPAVILLGHYHKLWVGNIRNVWVIQGGTTEDQTPFMRKQKIEAHVGGLIITLEQDPETGAIIECNGMRRYFNRGYYQGRWSHAGSVNHTERTP